MNDVVHPTHTAFDDALDFFVECNVPLIEFDEYSVVHGICLRPDETPFAHGWVEHHGIAVQAGLLEGQRIYYGVPLREFRERWRVREQTRYTVIEALRENYRSGHYGPWVEAYARLCTTDPREWETNRNG